MHDDFYEVYKETANKKTRAHQCQTNPSLSFWASLYCSWAVSRTLAQQTVARQKVEDLFTKGAFSIENGAKPAN